MIRRVIGVDFSGAKDAGRTTWVAELRTRGRRLRLVGLDPMHRLCGSTARAYVISHLVQRVLASRHALWAINFPFGFPIEVMPRGCCWIGQFDFLHRWGEDAYGAGVECLRRALKLGGPVHIRRQTDREEATPFDAYHYRIIYQTFYGIRDVLGPLRQAKRTAVLPFQYRRLAMAERVVVEACPASTLKRLGLPHQNYKQACGGPLTPKRRGTRRAILAGLAELVEIDARHHRRIMRDGGADSLDAVLAGVGAWRCWREYDHRAIGRHPRYSREGRHYA
jgi:hypothetical protein